MALTVRPMEASLRDDFLRLHSEEQGCGWCRCVAWWVPSWEGWGERDAAANLALREALFERGEHDGYLLFEDDEPVAWAQVGRRDRLEKLVGQLEREPDPSVHAVTCFLVAPRARGRGLARTLLAGVLQDLEQRSAEEGIRAVEAYPRVGDAGSGGTRDALELWNGPESMLRDLGFRSVARVGERWVLRRPVGGAQRA